jgi:hypothetical protein
LRGFLPTPCPSPREHRSCRSSKSKGSLIEAYSLLCCFIKLIYSATGTPLSGILSRAFVSPALGAVPLLLKVARRGLLEEQLAGTPKVGSTLGGTVGQGFP